MIVETLKDKTVHVIPENGMISTDRNTISLPIKI